MATNATTDVYDVAVVGGGPAGLSLLNALRSSKSTSHLRLALVEAQDMSKTDGWSPDADQYSNRASSLTPASKKYLESSGAWSLLHQERVEPYYGMRVWDGLSSRGRIAFDSPASDKPIAFMTENQNLTQAMANKIFEAGDIAVFHKTSVNGIDLGPPADPSPTIPDLSQYPHVQLSTGKCITARLLVGADGINSPVRKFAGISTRGWDYDRHGVVATLKLRASLEQSGCSLAYQRFLPTGPIALLPLPGGFSTLVWTTTPERAAMLKSLRPKDFIAMVNAAFRLAMVDIDFMSSLQSGQESEVTWRSGVYPTEDLEQRGDIPRMVVGLQEGSVASFPLRLRQARSYTAHRIALIGDAAHTVHPLAGQGLNMGLSDSHNLASTIENAVRHGADIGDELQCLNMYNSDSWMANNRLLGVVDKLHWLYSARNPLITNIRGLGLGLVDQVPTLKGWLMGQAGGS